MKSRFQVVTVVAALLVAGAVEAGAQTRRTHFGAHGLYDFDGKNFGIGVQMTVPVARRLEFYPSFDYYFVDAGSLWGLNADLKYRVFGSGLDWIYLGSGLNITKSSFHDVNLTDTGINFIGGFESLRGKVHPFAEFRLTVAEGSRSQLAAGLNVTLGRH